MVVLAQQVAAESVRGLSDATQAWAGAGVRGTGERQAGATQPPAGTQARSLQALMAGRGGGGGAGAAAMEWGGAGGPFGAAAQPLADRAHGGDAAATWLSSVCPLESDSTELWVSARNLHSLMLHQGALASTLAPACLEECLTCGQLAALQQASWPYLVDPVGVLAALAGQARANGHSVGYLRDGLGGSEDLSGTLGCSGSGGGGGWRKRAWRGAMSTARGPDPGAAGVAQEALDQRRETSMVRGPWRLRSGRSSGGVSGGRPRCR